MTGNEPAGVPVSLSTALPHPDPAFPRLHGRPPRGWVNDPNGCSLIDGRYHLFFQYNPDSPLHDAIKWGHVSSADLLDWRLEPLALVNRPGKVDAHGCWSGCLVDDGGVPTAVYSAVIDLSGHAEVVLAPGDRRMVSFRQEEAAVAGMPDDPAITDVRDPFVFELDGHRYAIQGAGHRRGRPQVLVYGCDDLRSWTALGPLLTSDDPVAAALAPANIWECPNLALVDGRWVLIVSLWRWVDGSHALDGVRYLVGDLTAGPDGPRFAATAGGRLDAGPCFYAPQVLSLPDRTLLWAWSWERGRTTEQIQAAGWAGALTFARELSVVDGVLVSRPAAELDGLRREELAVVPGRAFDASAFDAVLGADAGRVSLWLEDRRGEVLVAQWDVRPSPLVPPRVLVDGSMIEIFDGSAEAFTTRAYPAADSRWRLDVDGAADLQAWRLDLPSS